jgi:2-polyprenyl-6-methoxyphenol hydroxylase-like FAD-dependent oxidoreductase
LSERCFDVVVVGGGPAGLAVAIETAKRGLSVALFEQQPRLADKACGEGVMPEGVRALETLGVRKRLPPDQSREFQSIRYVDSDGTAAEGRLPAPGLAVRRTALVQAMAERARELGAELRFGSAVRSHRRSNGSIVLDIDRGIVTTRMLVGADGLASRLRRAEKLDVDCRVPRRFGLRRHFRCAPPSPSVEVHLAEGAEAYITPVSDSCVGVAFLWSERDVSSFPSPGVHPPETRWRRLERKFPQLAPLLEGATPCSRLRGAGPFARAVRCCTQDRFALVGDAAGYVDAITGEGISMSLLSAIALARILPDALQKGAHRATLAPYEREFTRIFGSYARTARAVLAVVRRPHLRRGILLSLARFPSLFDRLLAIAIAT